MPPKTIDFLLDRLLEQAMQSTFKGGSPAEPLIRRSVKDSGGLKNVKVVWPGCLCGHSNLLLIVFEFDF